MELAISKYRLQPEDIKRFSQLGEIAELFESLDVEINGDMIMGLLVSELFIGRFDPEDLSAVPSRYRQSEFFNNQTVAVPRISSRGGPLASRYVFGSSRNVVALMHRLKALPIEMPDKLTDQFIDKACSKLAHLPIDQFSNDARDILDCVLVKRTILRKWFEAGGMVTPIEDKVGNDPGAQPSAANCNIPVHLELTIADKEEAKPGRPESDLWPRVQELVTELHGANPECYNNAMASEIHERLIAEFPEQKVLALTTIQGKMMALRDQARADLDDTQDQV